MIIPSIDVRGGRAVQLVEGREQKIDGGDPLEVAERFGVIQPLAVIDLDAALGKGDNRAVIEQLVGRYRCRVGGGIRSVDSALRWLDTGAEQVILGTAARPEILEQLPRDRVIAALDAREGDVVVKGWTEKSGERVEERLPELAPLVGGFLLTLVEHEGHMGGIDLDAAERLQQLAGDARVTMAGGITTAEEVAALDALGMDAQVGMALYTGRLSLGHAVAATLTSDRPDGLIPTVVCDRAGTAIGLVYSSRDTVAEAIDAREGIYHSRSRGRWRKGETSGNVQRLLRAEVDCDRDALRFQVEQTGTGFCHTGTWSCFNDPNSLDQLTVRLQERLENAEPGSYTKKLLDDPELLRKKLLEEAEELAQASGAHDVAWEAADVIYFALVAMVRGSVNLDDVSRELSRRSRQVRRRSATETK